MTIESCLGYIDPMSGALLLQVVIAAVVGCLAFFRRSVWGLVRAIFRMGTCCEGDADSPDSCQNERKTS